MVLYHSEAWSCEQLQAGMFRNPAGIIVWCHSTVPSYDIERKAVKVLARYPGDRRSCVRGIWPRGTRQPLLSLDSEELL